MHLVSGSEQIGMFRQLILGYWDACGGKWRNRLRTHPLEGRLDERFYDIIDRYT